MPCVPNQLAGAGAIFAPPLCMSRRVKLSVSSSSRTLELLGWVLPVPLPKKRGEVELKLVRISPGASKGVNLPPGHYSYAFFFQGWGNSKAFTVSKTGGGIHKKADFKTSKTGINFFTFGVTEK